MATHYDAIIIGTGQAGPPLAARMNREGLKVAVSTAMSVPETGAEIQGSGVEPHERVEVRLEDLREGRDPTLEAARAW
jgi:choline dehydrogenase-like flavoprotein